MTITVDENEEAFDLYHDGGYRFAIKNVPEKFGEIRVSQVTHRFNETSQNRESYETPLELRSCYGVPLKEDGWEDSIFGEKKIIEKINIEEWAASGYMRDDYLCPTNAINMTVSG